MLCSTSDVLGLVCFCVVLIFVFPVVFALFTETRSVPHVGVSDSAVQICSAIEGRAQGGTKVAPATANFPFLAAHLDKKFLIITVHTLCGNK